MKTFNTATCRPNEHYMVDIIERLEFIRNMVAKGDNFCINRGRQYVIELKIWRGNAYNERGEEQLCRYLEYFELQEDYPLSFYFNKTKSQACCH
ncbi:MAG: hypothetical protein Q4A15_13460 [Prevotellaceae bacterium]|nr:hypothetical protein [Prevotellaceae bacterium]